MITHSILVEKPVLKPIFPIGFSPVRHTPITQEELNKQVDHYGFQVGDFVTMAGLANSLYNVHCIMHVEKNIARCKSIQGRAAAYLFCQVESAATMPWIRWDTPNDYRLLSEEEYKQLIGNNSDNLRHNCHEKSKYLLPSYTEGTGSPV